MKKLIALSTVIALSVGALSACSPSTPDPATSESAGSSAGADASGTTPSDAQTITVWAWDPNYNISIMNEAASRYKENHPDINIEVVEMAKADVEQKLHTTLASKMTEGLPDIVLIEDYNAQKYLQSYPGSFADLTDAINYNDFAPYKVELMTLGGRTYGVPFDTGVSGLFYRSDVLEEAGYTAADLENITWDRFIEIGLDVKAKTGMTLFPFDKSDGGIIRIMLNSAGLWYFDADGNPTVSDNEVLKESLETYKKFIDSGVILPTSGWNEWVGGFNNDESASVTTGCWIIGSIKAATEQSGKWAVAPTPRLNHPSSKNTSNLGGSSWYILDAAKNKDIAVDFMNEIYASDVEFYQTILTNNGAVGSYLPALEGEAYTAGDEFFGGQAVFADLGKWMKEIPSINYGLYTYEADSAIITNSDAYLAGSKSVEQALADAEAQLMSQIQ